MPFWPQLEMRSGTLWLADTAASAQLVWLGEILYCSYNHKVWRIFPVEAEFSYFDSWFCRTLLLLRGSLPDSVSTDQIKDFLVASIGLKQHHNQMHCKQNALFFCIILSKLFAFCMSIILGIWLFAEAPWLLFRREFFEPHVCKFYIIPSLRTFLLLFHSFGDLTLCFI